MRIDPDRSTDVIQAASSDFDRLNGGSADINRQFFDPFGHHHRRPLNDTEGRFDPRRKIQAIWLETCDIDCIFPLPAD